MTTLYHYCSTSSFASILSSKTIRLSSLIMANDTMEGKLVAETICRLAEQDGLAPEIAGTMKESIAISGEGWHGLGFCLSEEGDLLSQWRGYAADGTGFSIGFSKKYLLSLSAHHSDTKEFFVLQQVEYEKEKQELIIRPTFDKVVNLLNKKPESQTLPLYITNEGAYLHLFALLPKLYCFKTDYFKEELEWRLINLALSDDVACDYYSASNRIVPYKSYLFEKLDLEPIVEVIIGPKNLTPVEVVENFLAKSGFSGVKVVRSGGTYR